MKYVFMTDFPLRCETKTRPDEKTIAGGWGSKCDRGRRRCKSMDLSRGPSRGLYILRSSAQITLQQIGSDLFDFPIIDLSRLLPIDLCFPRLG